MTCIAVVQARAGSSRLPGKVFKDIGGEPMVLKVLRRVQRALSIDWVVLATTDDPSDDAVADLVAQAGFVVHRGSLHDVLDRYYGAVAELDDADEIVRVTADCPFVDPDIIDEVVAHRRLEGVEFAANRLPPPARRTYPLGLDVEVALVGALRTAWRDAQAKHYREHVMPYLYESGHFATSVIDLAEDLSGYRWTVDTPEDLAAVLELQELVGPEPFGWQQVLEVAREHPAISEVNRSSVQKAVDVVDERYSGIEDQS